MFKEIIDLFLQFADACTPFVVVDHYERAVVLRFGRFDREIGPDDGLRLPIGFHLRQPWKAGWIKWGQPTGFHLLWPLQIERALSDNVVPRRVKLGVQSLTTRDGINVSLRGVITAYITNIKKALLEVEGVDDALEDACYGAIGEHVASSTWDELRTKDFPLALTKVCREHASEYGIRIKRIQLSDLTKARTYRLFK